MTRILLIILLAFLFMLNSEASCLNYAPSKDIKSGKWGYVDENGKERTKFKYDLAFNFSYGKALALRKGVWYFIDKQNFKEQKADTFLQSYYNRIISHRYYFSQHGFHCTPNYYYIELLNPIDDNSKSLPFFCYTISKEYSYFHLIGENKIFIYTESYNINSIYNIETHEMLLDKQYNIITSHTKNGLLVSKPDTSEIRNMPFYSLSYFFYDLKNNSLTKIDLKDHYTKPGYSIVLPEFMKELSPSCFYFLFKIQNYEFEYDIGNTDRGKGKYIKVFVTTTDSTEVQIMNLVSEDFNKPKYKPFGKIPSNCECDYDSSFTMELNKLKNRVSDQNGYTQLEFQSYYLCKKHTSPEEWSKMTLTQFKVINGKLRYGAIREDKWVVEPKYAFMGVFN